MSRVRPFRRKARSSLSFPLVVATVAVAAFMLTLQWPGPGTTQPLATTSETIRGFACAVDYVNDGDTFRCVDGTRIRLHAVAARELDETCSQGHPCPAASGASAKAELTRLVDRQTVRCERVGQSYNRVTALCWTTSGIEVNCAMVTSGKAIIWDRFHRQRPICAG